MTLQYNDFVDSVGGNAEQRVRCGAEGEAVSNKSKGSTQGGFSFKKVDEDDVSDCGCSV